MGVTVNMSYLLISLGLCLLTALAHYSTSSLSPAESLRRSGALSSQGLSRPASQGQSCWKESLSRPSQQARLHLQTARPAPAVNQTLPQNPTPATKTLWWVWRRPSTFTVRETIKVIAAKWFLFHSSRATSNPNRTRRRAIGKNTSTSSSTLSVQPPRWRKKRWRSRKATHHPLQTGWARHPQHQQRRGPEKCLVRLIGKLRKTWRIRDINDTREGKNKTCNHKRFFARQGQASCYEGSGRAPPLGPPPSLDHPSLPPPHKEGTGKSHASLKLFKFDF